MKLSKTQETKRKWDKKNLGHKRNQQYEKRKELRKWFYEEIVSKVSCKKCGESHPGCMDFHHRDPSTKLKEVGNMLGDKFSKEKILEEVAKCDVLCANCHRIHHWNERKNERDSSNG